MFCQQYKQEISNLNQRLLTKRSTLSAIDRVMAIIEFSVTGEVLTANDNFLKTLGYGLSDIQGKHHRIFVEPSFASSAEYTKMWQALASGEFISGRFKRIGKQGNSVWIEASYNPVLNEQRQVVKIIKFATDITQQVQKELDAVGQLSAINRVMAVIEFDLQGRILTANDNFLKTMGYSLDEIKGKQHSLFVEPDYAKSIDYANFWSKLVQGQFIAMTFKRIGKGGKVVWIEASYNPILDDTGKPYKVVKYATDVGSNPNTKLLQSVIMDVDASLSSMSQGDLTKKLQGNYHDQRHSMFYDVIEDLQRIISHLVDQLSSSVINVIDVANNVNGLSSQVSQSATNLSNRVQEQAAALEETSANMQNMANAVQENTQNSKQASELVHQVQNQTIAGVEVMQKTITAMQSIKESSNKIADIVTMIDAIAFQTNLLALNAAVEAARAGEHGRGFAVVAGEVRALAQKSAEAAKDIKILISDSVTRIDAGTQLADKSGEMLSEITASIEQVTRMIENIANASGEQSHGIRQVNQAIADIDKVTQENAALVEETTAAAENLNNEATQLNQNMSFFKTR